MRLRYLKNDGTPAELTLGERPITIGRNPDSDIILMDEKASRIHCGIRLWDGEYYLKDLKSRNGTYVNGRSVEVATLKPGDQIRIGHTEIFFEGDTGPTTALHEIKGEMEMGKGYSTILRQIVDDAPQPAAPAPQPQPAKPGLKLPPKKPGRIIFKKKA
jgi:pSer/pThr/pTyr-binding forkhead associated (FHA) protein